MKVLRWIVVVLIFVAASIAADRLRHRVSSRLDADEPRSALLGDHEDSTPEAPVHVRLSPIVRGAIRVRLTMHGTVQVPPGSSHLASVPVETVIEQVLVDAGQAVSEATPVAKAALSPEASAAKRESLAALTASRAALALARERLQSHLGTTQEVQQAEQAVALAEPKAAFWETHAADPIAVDAGAGGIVTKVIAQPGQVVAAGAPIAEIATGPRMARLGLEPARANAIRVGDQVTLIAPRRPDVAPFSVPVTMVSGSVDPETRLVDVVTTLSAPPLNIGEAVRGEAEIDSPQGWRCPRSAIASSAIGDVIYTVAQDRAVAHRVRVVAEDDTEAVVEADDLADGARVVSGGSYELRAGAPVKVEASP